MERPDLAEDARFALYRPREGNYFELAKIVEAEFATRSYSEWEKRLTDYDVPFAPVLSVTGYLESEQVKWLELADVQPDGLALMRAPWRFGGQRPDRSSVAPRVGADSRDVAGEVYSEEKVNELAASGVLDVADPELHTPPTTRQSPKEKS
jgi:crotonobetainyl-CoA:carnitine CoA-transferase CaiB-like acyl-CoA transferase